MGILHRVFGRRSADVWRTEARLLQRLGYVQPPEAVQWISTSVCDLSCPHCYSNAGKKSTNELTTEEAKRFIVDELVRLNRPVLVVAGGETLLRKDFGHVIEYAHRRAVPWAIHTHGGRVEQHLETFEKHPPIMAAISLDGPRDYHDEFRGKVGAFDAAIRAMMALKRIGVREVVAGTTINRQNADLLLDMVPDVLDSGADSWGFHLMTPEGRASEHAELLPTPRQLRRVASFGRRMRALFHVELDNEWGGAGDEDPFYRDAPFRCGAGRFTCVVAANGDVMPCTTTDPNESHGNVREKRLSEIWAEGFAPFRSSGPGVEADCDDCWLNTRHGHSARSAFTMDLFEPDGRRMLPLLQISAREGALS